MGSIGDPTADGTVVRDDNTKPASSTPSSSGSSSPSSSSSSSGSSGGSGSLTSAQKDALLRALRNAYRAQYPDNKWPPLPGALVNAALKGRWSDPASVLMWLRKNDRKRYQRTAVAIGRARTANDKLDAIFGEKSQFKKAFIEKFVMGDPRTWDWGRFLEQKVVKSAVFKKEYPGWADFYKRNGKLTYEKAISKYLADKESYLDAYRQIVGMTEGEVIELPKSILMKAMAGGWDVNAFASWVKANDPAYLGSAVPKNKEEQITDFWHTVFGADADVPADIRDAYKRTDENVKFEDFFNNAIRNTEDFKAVAPHFEEWAKAQVGATDGTGMHVDPFEYFKDLQNWRIHYETISENPEGTNEELIRKAMAGGWSQSRFDLEFKKTDPAYAGTSTAGNKVAEFTNYWRGMFGTDAVPDARIMDDYVKGNADDVTTTFESIKATDKFAAEYGEWSSFVDAQSGKGHGGEIIKDPAIYKQYEDAFYEEFRKVEVEPPQDFKQMFFKSGVDESQLNHNLSVWAQSKVSSQWATGQKADVATAAGINQKAGENATVAGANLRERMQKALQQHKGFANSKFNTFDSKKSDDGTLIKSI